MSRAITKLHAAFISKISTIASNLYLIETEVFRNGGNPILHIVSG